MMVMRDAGAETVIGAVAMILVDVVRGKPRGIRGCWGRQGNGGRTAGRYGNHWGGVD